jgi:hypothetical protein
MPKLPGKPCFGNPIAWVAHGVLETLQTKTGLVRSRCGKCLAREGCGVVAEARLNISVEVASAAQAFRTAGGATAFHKGLRDESGYALGNLEKAILRATSTTGPFSSVNDEYALNWVRSERDRVRADDARRQRQKRARDARLELKEHRVPSELMEQLEHERTFRIARFCWFAKSPRAPAAVTRDPDGTNAAFTADVWRAKTILFIRKGLEVPTAYAIAKHMFEEGRGYGLTQESLRDRVNRAIPRIHMLETRRLPDLDVQVWPPFSPREALNWLANDPLRDLR